MRRWSWIGWSLVRNSRAVWRSKMRSKNRSRAARGERMVVRNLADEDHRPGCQVPADEATGGPCDILSPRSVCRSAPTCSSRTRGHDARDPHRIILRTLRHALHVRVGCAHEDQEAGPIQDAVE